jgi:hypothetical protein
LNCDGNGKEICFVESAIKSVINKREKEFCGCLEAIIIRFGEKLFGEVVSH